MLSLTKGEIIMATIIIDTDKLDASLSYYEHGYYGIKITYEGKIIKKVER